MSKERYDEIINEVYSRYADSHWSEPINPDGQTLGEQLWSLAPMKHNKETFVNEIKCVKEFSEKWGLKIEERELSLEERLDFLKKLEIFQERVIGNAKSEMIPVLPIHIVSQPN
jgi:hypothetical protein